MDWQLITVVVVLALAVGYVARSAWRTWFGPAGKGGCASGCGTCASATPTNRPEDRRRIELPRA